jgi:hypothetical protein
MTRARALLGVGGLCLVLAGCATHGGPSDAGLDKTQARSARLTLDTPISELCDDPRGRAVLDRNLPGLRTNPNYFLFQGFSLRQLASMSGGKITKAKLESIRLDLAATPSTSVGTH